MLLSNANDWVICQCCVFEDSSFQLSLPSSFSSVGKRIIVDELNDNVNENQSMSNVKCRESNVLRSHRSAENAVFWDKISDATVFIGNYILPNSLLSHASLGWEDMTHVFSFFLFFLSLVGFQIFHHFNLINKRSHEEFYSWYTMFN